MAENHISWLMQKIVIIFLSLIWDCTVQKGFFKIMIFSFICAVIHETELL